MYLLALEYSQHNLLNNKYFQHADKVFEDMMGLRTF